MLLFQKCLVLLITTSSCQGFGNDVTFLGLLPLYNFFSSQNRPVQHPTLSLYESLNPTQDHTPTTPKISPLIPVYAFLNNFGLSKPEPPTMPTYVIPQPVITTEEPPSIEEPSTDFPIPSTITSRPPMTPTTTSRPPIPPPPRPPPPPLPPPITSSVVQNIYDPQVNKTMRPLPLPKPSGSGYRPHRPIIHPPTPPPGYIRTSEIPNVEEEEEEEEENNVDEVNGMQEVSSKPHSHHRTHAYKYSSTQDGRVAYEVLS